MKYTVAPGTGIPKNKKIKYHWYKRGSNPPQTKATNSHKPTYTLSTKSDKFILTTRKTKKFKYTKFQQYFGSFHTKIIESDKTYFEKKKK